MSKQQQNWRVELSSQAEKNHKITAWVAIVLNLLWFIGDRIEIPEYWQQFFYFRLTVSTLTLLVLLLYKKLQIQPFWIVFVPVIGIAIQNAYMYSLMDISQLQKHTFAYLALFIGSGMLVLWELKYSVIVVIINLIASLIFISLFSNLEISEILTNGGLLTFTVSIFMIVLIQTRYSLTKKEIIARFQLQESKQIIEEKSKDITDSIMYAKKIQDAILPDNELLNKYLKNYFVFYKPRDIVCGDFYWFTHCNNKSFIAVADCTGHGVPGAFMSMIGNTLLNDIVIEKGIEQPSEILNQLRLGIIKALKQSGEEERKEGMDIALCSIDVQNNVLEYAGAYNPLYLIRNGELTETKADRMPIGKYLLTQDSFTNHTIELDAGDTFYIFSDGFVDQFGGPDDKKYKSKKFKELLLSIHAKPMDEQHKIVSKELESWISIGQTQQIDDICLLGIKY